MNTRLFAVLALVLAGCADSPVGPEPEPEPTPTVDPVGAYVLVALDGKPLPGDLANPALTDCKVGGRFCVTQGAMKVEQGGAYLLTFRWTRYYNNGQVDQTGSVEEPGRWRVEGTTVHFAPAASTGSCGTAEGKCPYTGTVSAAGELISNRFTFRK